MRNVVYISGALFSAPDLASARALYESLARVCVDTDYRPYLPHKETDPQRHANAKPVDVFRRDFEMLNAADLVVAIVTHASSGMGAELGIAFTTKKPVIAFYDAAHGVSRFLLGMLEIHGCPARPFKDPSDALEMLRDELVRRR
jgi:nucleoside 2-deoxyribosyltransferase